MKPAIKDIRESAVHKKEVARWRDSLLSEGHRLFFTYETYNSVAMIFRHRNGNQITIHVGRTYTEMWKNGMLVGCWPIPRLNSDAAANLSK